MQRREQPTGRTVRRTFLQAAGATAALLAGVGGASAQDDETETEPGTETETEPGTPGEEPTPGEESPTRGRGGLISVQGGESVEETVTALEPAIEESPAELLTTIDHARQAQRADISIQPSTLLIFGNPATGASLMAASQTAGIDLPQKMLVWEDEDGQVWVTYNDPRFIAARHGIQGQRETLDRIRETLQTIATSAGEGGQ